jgi:hypothetical protein
MGKRGQATIFIVLGILLVAIVVLYFVGVQTNVIPPLLTTSDAASELNDIDSHVEECLEDVGMEYLNVIGIQGGYITTADDTFRLYNDTTVSYLCWNQQDSEACTNRLLTVSKMETQLEETLNIALQTCINVYDYSKGVTVRDDWELDIQVNQETVDIDLFYPIEVIKGEDSASEDEFSVTLDVPLGELYTVSQDIVNDHAVYGDFDPLLYMLSKLSKYTIYKNKPYPDTIYQVKMRENPYVFQFGIQGEPSV